MELKQLNALTPYIRRFWNTLLPSLTVSKALNICISLSEMKTRRVKLVSRPFVYRIDPCSLCNLRCISCNTHKTKTKEKRLMDYNDFVAIVDRIKKYSIRCSLYDMGEPFLTKKIYKMISYLTVNNISSVISTHFNFFKKDNLPDLFDSGLTVLEPCMDGFTQENYVKYRVGGNIETVKENIKNVMEYKLKNKRKYPIVDTQIVEFDHIREELPLIDSFLESVKVDKITHRAESLGFNSPETSIKGKKEIASRATCFWLYLSMMVRPDGKVYPCCGRGFDRFSYGNLLEQSLDEIWNNAYYRFSRELFKKGPDLPYNREMENIPCLTCGDFLRQRRMASNRPISYG